LANCRIDSFALFLLIGSAFYTDVFCDYLSDSDSCSSSGSETDSIKASKPTSREEKKQPGVGIDKKEDDSNSEKIVVNG
jgi:hypothetical protein